MVPSRSPPTEARSRSSARTASCRTWSTQALPLIPCPPTVFTYGLSSRMPLAGSPIPSPIFRVREELPEPVGRRVRAAEPQTAGTARVRRELPEPARRRQWAAALLYLGRMAAFLRVVLL